MKNLNTYISEAIKITSKSKVHKYNYCPKTKKELEELVFKLIEKRGLEADLNDIDTSQITDMSYIFSYYDEKGNFRNSKKCLDKFNGDISLWDVSNVTNMKSIFSSNSKFTGEHGDISLWDVSNVVDMRQMFHDSIFNGNLSKWNVSKVENMSGMFYYSKFTGENCSIKNWDVRNVENMSYMFSHSRFNKKEDLENWNVSNVKDMRYMFENCPLEKNQPK